MGGWGSHKKERKLVGDKFSNLIALKGGGTPSKPLRVDSHFKRLGNQRMDSLEPYRINVNHISWYALVEQGVFGLVGTHYNILVWRSVVLRRRWYRSCSWTQIPSTWQYDIMLSLTCEWSSSLMLLSPEVTTECGESRAMLYSNKQSKATRVKQQHSRAGKPSSSHHSSTLLLQNGLNLLSYVMQGQIWACLRLWDSISLLHDYFAQVGLKIIPAKAPHQSKTLDLAVQYSACSFLRRALILFIPQ